MSNDKNSNIGFLAICILVGLLGLGYFISDGIIEFKKLDRVVTVKGLSEMEIPANIAIWPIKFNEASNDLESLYATIQRKSGIIEQFLVDNGFTEDEISVSPPNIRDIKAQGYYDASKTPFRYTSVSTVTVYTDKIDNVLSTQDKLIDLGKKGIALATQEWDSRVQYLFTKLNDIKPDMIEKATRNAREAADKFAQDSGSEIGKIKSATQGQFSINDRDSNTSHIKTVRVVVTLEYYLSD